MSQKKRKELAGVSNRLCPGRCEFNTLMHSITLLPGEMNAVLFL
jgi:hypothetical protein